MLTRPTSFEWVAALFIGVLRAWLWGRQAVAGGVLRMFLQSLWRFPSLQTTLNHARFRKLRAIGKASALAGGFLGSATTIQNLKGQSLFWFSENHHAPRNTASLRICTYVSAFVASATIPGTGGSCRRSAGQPTAMRWAFFRWTLGLPIRF